MLTFFSSYWKDLLDLDACFFIFQEKSSPLSFYHWHSSKSNPELSVPVLDGSICASQLLRCRWTQGKSTPWKYTNLIQIHQHSSVSCCLLDKVSQSQTLNLSHQKKTCTVQSNSKLWGYRWIYFQIFTRIVAEHQRVGDRIGAAWYSMHLLESDRGGHS